MSEEDACNLDGQAEDLRAPEAERMTWALLHLGDVLVSAGDVWPTMLDSLRTGHQPIQMGRDWLMRGAQCIEHRMP